MNNTLTPINDLSSKAFDELFARYQDLDTDCLLIYIIDNVKASALVHLAEQFHIMGHEGWNNCRNESEQRELIKNAIKLHKYKGTKYALIQVLDVLGIEGRIFEWFDYDGDPYYFKIRLSSFSFSSDNKLLDNLIALINEYKNVRSHLENIELDIVSRTQNNTNVALGVIENRFCKYICTQPLRSE